MYLVVFTSNSSLFLSPLSDSLCRDCSVPPLLFKLFFWLGYCNSAMNPIIYTCSSMEFRRAFLAILTCKRCYSRPRISLTDDRSRKRAPRISVRALRRHHQQFKEQELELALRDMSSSSSSTPEAVSKVVSGLKLSSISLPHIFIRSGDIVCEDRPKSLAGLQNKDMKTNMCLTCTSKRFLKGLKTITSKQESSPHPFYDDPQIFHQQLQTWKAVVEDKTERQKTRACTLPLCAQSSIMGSTRRNHLHSACQP